MQRKSWEQFATAPPARRRHSQHSAPSAGPYGSTGLLQLPTYPRQHLKPRLNSWTVQSLCIHLQEVFLPSMALPTVPGLHSPMPLIHKINRIKSIK